MKINHLTVALIATIVALTGWSCNDDPEVVVPVDKPSIGIMEPEFDTEAMEFSVMIAPSTDATAWYWKIESQTRTEDSEYVKEEGAAAKEIKYAAQYGVEYLISAYAENKAGKSDIATKKFCAMPKDELSIAIGDITLDKEKMTATATIYPSKPTKSCYWGVIEAEADTSTIDWTVVEGNKEFQVSFPYKWGKRLMLYAYAKCDAITCDIISKVCEFEPSVPTIEISKPNFDEATMMLSFNVTPSEDTDHWYYGIYNEKDDSNYTVVKDNKATKVNFKIEHNKEYKFIFRAENAINKGEEKFAEFYVIGAVADIAIENITSYTIDVVVTKKEHCVRYVAGMVHTSAYDRNSFIEQAKTSLNPDSSYPFAAFNSATESRTFSEQDLVRNSLISSNENAGIILIPNTSYTIAVYGEDEKGNNTVTTKEVVIPEVEINGSTPISVEVSEIGLSSAKATVTTEVGAKVLTGYIDPALAKADTNMPFDFEGKTEIEIKRYIARVVKGVPAIYSEPITYTLSEVLTYGTEYVAYAVAIKDGKVGEVAYSKFTTARPSLSGVAKVTAAEIEEQTEHTTLTVQLTTDANAKIVRLYAAPESDHASYAESLEMIMDASEYQNYREEYEVKNGSATCVIDIYHPGSNYYMYASAVDADGHAGEMVCVTTLAGLETEFYTTIQEPDDTGGVDYSGTGSATLTGRVVDSYTNDDGELRINVTLTATDYSDNVAEAWYVRLNDNTVNNIEQEIKAAFKEYITDFGHIIGSTQPAIKNFETKYIDDFTKEWDPKLHAFSQYDSTYGGTIVVLVIKDSDDKFRIDSYCYYTNELKIVEF